MLCLGRRAGVEDWIFAKTLVPRATVNDVARARPRSKSVAKERSGLHHALKQNSLGKVSADLRTITSQDCEQAPAMVYFLIDWRGA